MIDARAFIRAKRDRQMHGSGEIQAFIMGCLRGEVPDYQLSAWLMAAFLNGLDVAETDALTEALLRSGRVFDWSDLKSPTADKHSTGGVGDKISLILAPVVAACGVGVPMVSGRGLGHTGGTLDKLESIPGFRTRLSPETMRAQLATLGVVMVGQGPDLAPADGMVYALRDVTSTVECEAFIVASIVSKKIAAGSSAVVYDVKCGNGAFMTSLATARHLARRLVDTTRTLGRSAGALVTDMSQPLGSAVGNALEVREAVDVLRGGGPTDVRFLTLELAALMLELCGAERERHPAMARATRALESGAAWETFLALVEAQGGDPGSVQNACGLPQASVIRAAHAPRSGYVARIDTFGLGELLVRMGGGRAAKGQEVDPRVGLKVQVRLGDAVRAGDVMAELHLAIEDTEAMERSVACFKIQDAPAAVPEIVLERVD